MHEQTIGEVRTLWVDDPGHGGWAEVTLDFRVGVADEPLPQRGITALAQQLAVLAGEEAEMTVDGTVDDVRLHLHLHAEPREVTERLALIARALHATPPAVVERERHELLAATERDDHGPGQYSWVLSRLCGPNGAGRLAYKLLGLRRITPEDVRDWTARFCTRGNTVVTLTCPPPDDLADAFAALPPGPPIPPPPTTPLPALALPVQAEDPDATEVTIAAIVEAGDAADALAHVVGERAAQELPDARVSAGTTPIDGAVALVRVGAPATAETAGAVRDALLALLAAVAADGGRPGELDSWASALAREADHAGAHREDLRRAAFDVLMGRPASTAAARLAAGRALGGDEVGGVARAVLDAALVVLPPDAAEAPAEGHTHVDARPDPEVGGAVWRRAKRTGRGSDVLVCRDEGVELDRSGERVAIRFDDLAVAVREDDGSLQLVGTTGSWVEVDPRAWSGGDDLVEELAARVPAELLVPSTVEAQRARVREAARTLRSRALVGEELRALPAVLRADEEIHALVRARNDWALGLLAVTSRRVLYVYAGTDEDPVDPRVEEILRAEVASAKAERRLTGTELVVRSTRGRELKLRAGRAKQLAALITR